MSTIVLQSIVVDEGRVQVSYFDPAGVGPEGVDMRVAVINTHSGAYDAEMAEITDAALQLVTAWEGRRREFPGPRGLPGT